MLFCFLGSYVSVSSVPCSHFLCWIHTSTNLPITRSPHLYFLFWYAGALAISLRPSSLRWLRWPSTLSSSLSAKMQRSITGLHSMHLHFSWRRSMAKERCRDSLKDLEQVHEFYFNLPKGEQFVNHSPDCSAIPQQASYNSSKVFAPSTEVFASIGLLRLENLSLELEFL